ncbi:MAG TPA: TIM barrel protein [Acidimicrobiales bacterium]|nr:TIM barrel protein [Acidimicrobiales bacterium]
MSKTRLGPNDSTLCTGTIAGVALSAKVRAAAAAGFRALSVRPREYEAWLGEGWHPTDVRTFFDDHGVAVAELDPVMAWLPGSAPDPRNAHSIDEILRIAEVLQPHCLSVLVDPSYRGTIDEAIAPFAELCARAAHYGYQCALEFFAWSPLRTVHDAWRMVDQAGHPNGAMIFDNWHHYRAGGQVRDLDQVDVRRIVGVQLSDAPAAPAIADVARECMTGRLWPGEGDTEVAATVRHLRARGCTAPLGVEVFGPGDPTERAYRAAAALAGLSG